MLNDIVNAEPLEGYRLHLRLEDGAEGTVDLIPQLSFRGVFAPLREPSYFRRFEWIRTWVRSCGRTERIWIQTFSTPISRGSQL